KNNLEKLNSNIEILLEIQKDLRLIYSKLKRGIESFCEIQNDFVEDFEKNPMINYLFVNHVIDKDKLEAYFQRNKGTFVSSLSDSLEKIISDGQFNKNNFKQEYKTRIIDNSRKIIDF